MGGSEAPLLSETIRAAVYARTSSPSQRFGHSIGEQVRQCVQRCQMQGWEVQYVFRDEAKSGKDTDRPMFQQMLDRARQGAFDVLLFWKLDRFSRSIHHAVRLEKQFREWGVALHSVTEQLDTTTPAGQFNFRNIANAAEFEREMISQRTKMGHAARATEGKWPNGAPPLGYGISSDGRLSVDMEEAELVREIFRRYIEFRSMPEVVDYLVNKENADSLARSWTPNAVSILLRNNLYTGRYSVGEVEKQVPEYQIVSDSMFEKAMKVRTRFTKGFGKQGTMDRERKRGHTERITRQYKRWLNSTE